LKTGVELDGVRDAECRDTGVMAWGVLLAVQDRPYYSQQIYHRAPITLITHCQTFRNTMAEKTHKNRSF